MEFPDAGKQCFKKDCKQLDFLPFTCTHCSEIFCKEHFDVTSHACPKFIDNVTNDLKKIDTYKCSEEGCLDKSTIELPCPKCQKHFCLSHRHHNCFALCPEKTINQSQNWEKQKKEFSETKSAVDQSISLKLKKSKNSEMANKIKLMKLKNKSSGHQSIPQSERCYFYVNLPIASVPKIYKNPQGIFVSTNWSVGKIIDTMASLLNVPNYNNEAKSKKLRLFHHETGKIITNQMDVFLKELLLSKEVIETEELILEYIDEKNFNSSLYA